MNRAVTTLSKLLEPADREYVCGDIAELRLSPPAAAANILSLVIRRQLAEWSEWGPWVALLGVAGLAGWFLSESLARVETAIFIQIRTYLHYGVAYEPGGVSFAQEILYAATAALALLLRLWACGYVLASFSRRALWITALVFYCILRDSWALRLVLSGNMILRHGLSSTMLFRLLPLEPVIIAFLFALIQGARSARKGTLSRSARLGLTITGFILVLLLTWMENWFASGFARWSGQPFSPTPFLYRVLPLLAGAWPVFVLSLLQGSRRKPESRTA